ncbi:bifunctional ligase/repressor BirA [Caedimonas varicaedens]|jgi:BirA family biotin operon repressor/biotin-[acetyl-CoA-carboxylase] ligase|uniref:biotin--[biotin carboxyl-carrier protein] ligase n=1 Tax=Caedimonas varicaedens TaxID=1629334 RepID=A0A0K8MDH5_9PROT|nr:bifunctional ligase/repressor BirA [Caedimonas varicaedens]
MISLPPEWILNSYDCVSSTMDVARLHLSHGNIIWAKFQTAGRGRQERPWEAKRGNLLCSFVIRPKIPFLRVGEAAFVSALGVGQALSYFLPDPTLLSYKWPNDILVGGRKIAGILLEVEEPFVVVGIGINIVSHPGGISYPVTSLGEFSPHPVDCETVLEKLVECFQQKLEVWDQKGFSPIREEWLTKAHCLGKKITLKSRSPSDNSEEQGLFYDIDQYGSLLLKFPDGIIKVYHTGDVFLA